MPTVTRIYVCEGGNDSPAPATPQLKLEHAATPANALKTIARAIQLAIDYFNGVGDAATTGKKFFDNGGGTVNAPVEIIVNGRVFGPVGTVAPTVPDMGFALMNCAATGTPKCIRPWSSADGTPPLASGIKPAELDPIVLPTLTWNLTGDIWTTTLPAGLTAAKISRVLVQMKGTENIEGFTRRTLTLAGSAAAVVSGTNSYFIDGARLLTMCFTNAAGTAIGVTSTLVAGTPYVVVGAKQELDPSDLNVGLQYVADATVPGTASNAALCLQNAAPVVGRCTIGPFICRNASYTAGGQYHICTESSRDVDIISPECHDSGHHYVGHGGTGANTNNRVIGLSGGRFVAASGGGFYAIGVSGGPVRGLKYQGGVCRPGPVLSPNGVAEPTASGGIGCSNIAGQVAGDIQSVSIEDHRIIPSHASGTNTRNGGFTGTHHRAVAASLESDPRAYPVVFRRCEYGPFGNFVFGSSGAANDVVSEAFTDGVLNLTGAGGATAYGWCPFTVLCTNAGTLTCRKLLFHKSLIIIRGAVPLSFNGNFNFAFTTGLEGVGLYFKDCVVINDTQMPRGTTNTMFQYVNPATCTSGVFAEGTGFFNLHRGDVGSSFRLCGGENQTYATMLTRQKFTGCHYAGFDLYSANADRDTQAEWQSVVDATGTFSTNGSLNDRVNAQRIRRILSGTTLMRGGDPIDIIKNILSGNTTLALPPRPQLYGSRIGRLAR